MGTVQDRTVYVDLENDRVLHMDPEDDNANEIEEEEQRLQQIQKMVARVEQLERTFQDTIALIFQRLTAVDTEIEEAQKSYSRTNSTQQNKARYQMLENYQRLRKITSISSGIAGGTLTYVAAAALGISTTPAVVTGIVVAGLTYTVVERCAKRATSSSSLASEKV